MSTIRFASPGAASPGFAGLAGDVSSCTGWTVRYRYLVGNLADWNTDASCVPASYGRDAAIDMVFAQAQQLHSGMSNFEVISAELPGAASSSGGGRPWVKWAVIGGAVLGAGFLLTRK